MTHSWGTLSTPLSNPRYQPDWAERYQSLVATNMIRMLHYVCPWTDVVESTDIHAENGGGENAAKGIQYSLEQNFGELEFDWEERTVRLRAMGENPTAPPLLMAQLSMDQLGGRSALSSQHVTADDYRIESARQTQYGDDVSSAWICINNRGRDTPMAHMVGHVSSAVVLIALAPLPLLIPTYLVLVLVRRWSTSKTNNRVTKTKATDRWMRLTTAMIPFRFKTLISMAAIKQSKPE